MQKSTKSVERCVAVVADIVGSRQVADRAALQEQLRAGLAALNAEPAGLLSPYTVTLGDEFQAVVSDPRRLWRDATQLDALLMPVRLRWALGVGELQTPINPEQAIGMDGPAFHLARGGIDELKKAGGNYFIGGVHGAPAELANAALGLVGHQLEKWHPNRHTIFALYMRQVSVREIAGRIGISEQAVYKNINDGAMALLKRTLDALGEVMHAALEAD